MAGEARHARTSGPARREYWLVQQHKTFTLIRSSERPDTRRVPGERLKRLAGQFASEAEARARFEQIQENHPADTLEYRGGH